MCLVVKNITVRTDKSTWYSLGHLQYSLTFAVRGGRGGGKKVKITSKTSDHLHWKACSLEKRSWV